MAKFTPEQVLQDDLLFLKFILTIKDKRGRLVPLVANRAQQHFYENRSGRDLILKARQLGFSTFIQGLFYKKVTTEFGKTVVTISHDKTSTEKLREKFKLFYDKIPTGSKPVMGKDDKITSTFPALESSSYIGTAGNHSFGRGNTIHLAHLCLLPSQRVIGEDGYAYPITEPPSRVRSGNGALMEVRALSKIPCDKDVVRITLHGNSYHPIEATVDHKILCREYKTGRPIWKAAGEITQSDYVAFPISHPSHKTKSLPIPHKVGAVHVPTRIPLDAILGEFCGWYIAEGTGRDNNIQLSVHVEEEKIITPVLEHLKPYFTSYSFGQREGTLTGIYHIYGGCFTDFITSMLGTGDNKRIPDEFWNYPKDFLIGFLKGLFEGDGSFTDERTVSFCTVREHIAVQLKRLLISLRVGYPSIYVDEGGYRNERNNRTRYTVSVHGPGNIKLRRWLGKPYPPPPDGRIADRIRANPNHTYGRHRWRRGKNHYWAKVTKIEPLERPEYVYDLVLDEDPHSFCTIAGVVHNSEFAFWPEPKLVLTGLLEAIPDRHIMADSWVIIESTPNGADGEFYDMCMAALDGRGEWKLHFYAWWWDDEYRLPLDPGEVLEYTEAEAGLMAKHGLTPEQIKWRRAKIERLGDDFTQEYPEDPITCFQLSGRGRFDREALRLRLDTQCSDPVEERLYIKDFARWRIFEPPVNGARYVMGCDPSEGIGENNAAAVVRDYRTNTQVATLHGQFELTEFAKYVRDLAVHYNGAMVAVERNNHGHTVLNYLQSGTDTFPSYNHLYVHRDGRVGWHTNPATRPVMIDDLAEEYRRPDAYTIRDKAIVQQALRFVIKNKRAEADKGAYDDLVMADAIAGQMRQVPSGPSFAFGPPVATEAV